MTVLPKYGIRRYVLYYVLILIAYLQINQFLSSAVTPTSVCTTPECQKLVHWDNKKICFTKCLADYYKKIMNPGGNPCDDFYDYVCKKWGAENPRPKYTLSWGVHDLLEVKTMMDLKQLVEKKERDETSDEANVKSLYRACMDLPILERVPTAALRNITTIVGDWPTFLPDSMKQLHIPWQCAHNEYIRISGESSLFTYFLQPDTRNNRFVIRLRLQEIHSPYGMLIRKTNWDNLVERVNYKAFLMKLIKALMPPGKTYTQTFRDTVEKDVDNVIAFRENLRNATSGNEQLASEIMTIGEFQRRYGNANMDYLLMVRSMFKYSKDPYGKLIDNLTLINVQPQYFTKLAAILANTPDAVIGNHIHLYFAERHVQFTNDIESDLENSVSQYVKPTGSIRHQLERFKYCLGNQEIQRTLGQMYLKSHFSNSKKEAVNRMLLSMNLILQDKLSQSTWVAPELKKNWSDTLQRLGTDVGYPSWYFDKFGGSRATPADINPIKVEAHYSTLHNRMGISAAFMQWPIYDTNLPLASQCGAFLPIIGHELYHILNYHDFGQNTLSLKSPVARQEMMREFLERGTCFTEQYNSFKQKQNTKAKREKRLNSPLTINEDIPDVMGLKLAYAEYQEKLKSTNQNCTTLPGFQDYSCDQLFFIAFASSACSNSNPVWEKNILLTDDHNPSSIRTNAAVANMKEFADAFHCTNGQKLAPTKRCDLWK